MKLRLLSTAVLFNGADMLMMKRSANRSISPGMWAAIGGHLESFEIQTPRAAGLREILEETGISEHEITDFRLQYILLRRKDDEIRQQFIYFGSTSHREVSETDEGTLHWIPLSEVMGKDLPFTFRKMLEHYFQHGPSPHLWVGTISLTDISFDGRPMVAWSSMLDPNVQ